MLIPARLVHYYDRTRFSHLQALLVWTSSRTSCLTFMASIKGLICPKNSFNLLFSENIGKCPFYTIKDIVGSLKSNCIPSE